MCPGKGTRGWASLVASRLVLGEQFWRQPGQGLAKVGWRRDWASRRTSRARLDTSLRGSPGLPTPGIQPQGFPLALTEAAQGTEKCGFTG